MTRPLILPFLLSVLVLLLIACSDSNNGTISENTDQEIKIDLGNDGRRLGNGKSSIGIVEFYDFECSYCLQFHNQVLPKLKKDYIDTGEVLYVVKDLPLKNHKNAYQAAVAANCAEKQGKYWPMQGRLLSNQQKLGPKFMLKLAEEIELDGKKFKECVLDSVNQRQVMNDILLARRVGISATPSFLVGTITNNELTVKGIARGMPSYSELEKQIKILKGTP